MNNTSATDQARLMEQLLTPFPPSSASSTPLAESESKHFLLNNATDPFTRIVNAPNPLLEVSKPLLYALAELPSLSAVQDVAALREALVREIMLLQQLCDRAGFRREHVVTVRYCLCTALDEAIGQMPWAKDVWSAQSLLIQFHNESGGGEKFFLLLGRMAQQPAEHIQVLEVLYHLLSLGFQGRYALTQDGGRQLETIHGRLLALLLEHREPMVQELSPHWQGRTDGTFKFMRTLPVWVSASLVSVLVLGLFFLLHNKLGPQSSALGARTEALAQVPAPPAFPAALPMELWFSEKDKQTYGITVNIPDKTFVFTGVPFKAGDILPENMNSVWDILAEHLRTTNKELTLMGYTDNVPLRSESKFTDNMHLSKARAQAVANALQQRGVAADRVRVEGRGERDPVASNNTEAGKAKNRRVAVIVRDANARSKQSPEATSPKATSPKATSPEENARNAKLPNKQVKQL